MKWHEKFVAVDHSRWSEVERRACASSEQVAILHGNAVDQLSSLPSSCVNTVVTSPPYWNVRDYELDGQIGSEPLEDYVRRLVRVFDQVKRVLVPGGSAWLNLGDTYFNQLITENGLPPKTGWKRCKQLSLVPFRVAIALEDAGWWVRNVVAWRKTNAMPSSVRDRLSNTWEPLFLLTNCERYYFNLDAIRVSHATSDAVERRRAEDGSNKGKAYGKADLRKWLSSPRHRATIDGLQEVTRRPNAPDPVELAAYLRTALERKGESIKWVAAQIQQPFERTRHYFRTDRIGSRLPPPETWEELSTLLDLDGTFDDAMAVETDVNIFRNHPNGRNPGDVIDLPNARGSEVHFAMMPQELARWALRATLPSGGVALDPFAGTGTTGAAALELGGRFVGIDLDPELVIYMANRFEATMAADWSYRSRIKVAHRKNAAGSPALR
ncbi:site-specific DNA-methyltransferase [uncultured Thiodictyon sp.]|uniref:DNA-methyltransferase n=1 Tax=uncultured Thiodictyon sp. TaxID=1846217 RepID=UPI0025E08FC5|nr:site-specific DNA-methyltransferase [uncultured Thiodictyon sp.]